MSFFKFFLKNILPYKYSFIAGTVFIVLTNYFLALIPLHIQQAIDLIREDAAGNHDVLKDGLTVMVLLTAGLVVARTLSRVLYFNSARKIEFSIKNELLRHLSRLPYSYFTDNSPGQLISRINNDTQGIRLLYGFCLLQVINMLMSLSLTPYMMYSISPQLTLYVFIPIVVLFVLMRKLLKSLSVRLDKRQADLRGVSEFAVASLSGIDVIKSYGVFGWSERRFFERNANLGQRMKSISLIRSSYNTVLGNLENGMSLVIVGWGGLFVINDEMTVGGLAAFMTYSAMLTNLTRGLGWVTTILQEAIVGVRSVETILSQPAEPRSIQPPNPPESEASAERCFEKDGMTVRNLSYTYDDAEAPALENVSFSIRPGQVVGILGSVGSGKSTLVSCLNAHYNVPEGMIALGSADIGKFGHVEWRRLVRTVTQEPFLFSDTIEANILFGNAKHLQQLPGEEEWQEIFRSSSLAGEVERFPQQGKTEVGEKGIMLSGGQKQRISLARAMLSPSGLLILDNVMSAVDYATERFLIKEIRSRQNIKSMLIVSHRTKPVELADEIIVLEKGRVVERGSHTELLRRRGYYYETWRLQNSDTADASNGTVLKEGVAQ